MEPSLPEPGVYVEEHVETPTLPLRLQVVNEPERVLVKVKVPVGVIFVPELVSETLTEQVVGFPAITVDGEQLIETEVVRCVTVSVVDPVAPLTQLAPDRV